jgi:hypothetical protein
MASLDLQGSAARCRQAGRLRRLGHAGESIAMPAVFEHHRVLQRKFGGWGVRHTISKYSFLSDRYDLIIF